MKIAGSKIKNLRSGFSLVEALVVVSITVILSGILIVHSRTSERQIIFFREQSILVSAVLRAKAFSIETFQPDLQPGLTPPTDRICGWGIYFDKDAAQVIIFNDIASAVGASDCASANQMYNFGAGSDEKFETITLDPAVAIDCIGVNPGVGQSCSSNSSVLVLNVTFVPPDPTVVFKPLSGAEAVIVLKLSDPAQPRMSTIRISQAGQVSVN